MAEAVTSAAVEGYTEEQILLMVREGLALAAKLNASRVWLRDYRPAQAA